VIRSRGADSYTNFSLSLVSFLTTAPHFLNILLESIGIPQAQVENPWYYPSIGEYASLLEHQGFDVIYAILFPRPTPLAEGEAGIANWIKMFASPFLAGLSPEQQIQIIPVVEEYLKPTLYQQGTWTADYRRIRIVAIKL
ncbi:MAG: hypothetical protein V7K28_15665, partial [Nostoc sp.]